MTGNAQLVYNWGIGFTPKIMTKIMQIIKSSGHILMIPQQNLSQDTW